MVIPTIHLELPFRAFRGLCVLPCGDTGILAVVDADIVLKCAYDYSNAPVRQEHRVARSQESIAREKETQMIIRAQPTESPFILTALHIIPAGIFTERMPHCLVKRLQEADSVSDTMQRKWIGQLSLACAWLESAGIVHGDLRPWNIMLSRSDDIRVTNFDCSVKLGERLIAATEPFYRTWPKGEDVGCAATAQYAFASCMYTIRYYEEPFYLAECTIRSGMLEKGQVPDTQRDARYGKFMQQCWAGHYDTMAAVSSKAIELGGLDMAIVCPEDTGRSERVNMLRERCRLWAEQVQLAERTEDVVRAQRLAEAKRQADGKRTAEAEGAAGVAGVGSTTEAGPAARAEHPGEAGPTAEVEHEAHAGPAPEQDLQQKQGLRQAKHLPLR